MSDLAKDPGATALEASSSNTMEVDGVRRSENLWFDDGNLVLQVELTQFRVHKSMMARHSSVFRDMLSLPQPATPLENEVFVEGCPVVHLSDNEKDVEIAIGLFYDGIQELSQIAQMEKELAYSFKVDALARFGKKYDVPAFTRLAEVYLERGVPRTLSHWDGIWAGSRCRIAGDSNHTTLINLAWEMPFKKSLPCLFFEYIYVNSCRLELLLMNETGPVPLCREAHLQCLLGREAMMKWLNEQRVEAIDWGRQLALSCLNTPACTTEILQEFRNCLWPWVDSDKDFTWLGDAEFVSNGNHCKECMCPAIIKYEQIRSETWGMLPSFFGLPHWKDLKNDS